MGAPTLTLHQGGAKTVEEKMQAALVALEDLSPELDTAGYLRPAVDALARVLASVSAREQRHGA